MDKKERDILFTALKDKLQISRKEFDNFFALSKKVTDKIERLSHSKRLIEPPNYVAKTFNKIQSREDFDKRIEVFERVISRNYIKEQNEKTDNKFYEFVYDIADGDLYKIQKIYSKYKNLPIYKKQQLFDENQDLRRILYYKTEYDEDLTEYEDWTVDKLLGRLDKI